MCTRTLRLVPLAWDFPPLEMARERRVPKMTPPPLPLYTPVTNNDDGELDTSRNALNTITPHHNTGITRRPLEIPAPGSSSNSSSSTASGSRRLPSLLLLFIILIAIPTPTPTADTPERGFLRTAGGPRGRGPGARDGPALAVCAVEVLDCVAVPLHVAVSRRWRRVDAALPLLEAAWWGLGCVCCGSLARFCFVLWGGGG